eukprot:COSAG06_NODE_70230_length_193_cov_24.085106_1_plen_40_part_01
MDSLIHMDKLTEVSCFGCGVVWCWLCPVQEDQHGALLRTT